jgi:dienelactone hydrolase
MAYQLGQHPLGYEVAAVRALLGWLEQAHPGLPVGVCGYGEGGLVALLAAALDERAGAVLVSGHLRDRTGVWQEPIERNVWQLLREHSDAEVAALVAPRPLVVEAAAGPVVAGPPLERERRRGAAPGALGPFSPEETAAEVALARPTFSALGAAERLALVTPTAGDPGPFSRAALEALLGALGLPAQPPGAAGQQTPPADGAAEERTQERQRRWVAACVSYTQGLLGQAHHRRAAYWREADASSLEAWQRTAAAYRTRFHKEVIGRIDAPLLPPAPRSRLAYDEPAWQGYDVVLDALPDVFAYGVLLLPRNLAPGERRPVVVCQHGLEGRPETVMRDGPTYFALGPRLAERGYVVYAPQNPYIGGDAFRLLQRKANPLGLSLFSFIVAQHRQTLDWLRQQPFVDPDRIAFYGKSYGGKTAMRVPALLEDYCLSICSGDFNEWIVKTSSTDLPMGYLFTGEWEMFEFDLGNTFNYAEMASLIAPRPFMVERGHRDGVGLDEWVAFEYAKVRRRYADLGIAERTEIAFFEGGHEIRAEATFPFLDKHLRELRAV